jgi:hypothetical protein
VSEALLCLDDALLDYFDGDSAWCAWTGTADASTSVLYGSYLKGGSLILE